MARPLSRKGRLGFAFAGIALGIGAAVVINDGHHRVLQALLGVLVVFPYMCVQTLSWMGAGLDKVEERAWRRDRIARRAAAKTDTTTTTVRCWVCQHVSAVPRSQPTFVCEQCGAHLNNRTGPANSS
jgi:hypothetical protein